MHRRLLPIIFRLSWCEFLPDKILSMSSHCLHSLVLEVFSFLLGQVETGAKSGSVQLGQRLFDRLHLANLSILVSLYRLSLYQCSVQQEGW